MQSLVRVVYATNNLRVVHTSRPHVFCDDRIGSNVVSRFEISCPVPRADRDMTRYLVREMWSQPDWGYTGLIPFGSAVWYRASYVLRANGIRGIDIYIVNLTLRNARTKACRSACVAFLQCLGRRHKLLWELCVLVTKAAWETRRDGVWDVDKQEHSQGGEKDGFIPE